MTMRTFLVLALQLLAVQGQDTNNSTTVALSGHTLKLGGVLQDKGPGAKAKLAFDKFRDWANLATTQASYICSAADKHLKDNGCWNVQTIWRGSGNLVSADYTALIKNLTIGCGQQCADVLVAPYSTTETKKFIAGAVAAASTKPILIWGGAAPALFTTDCAGKTFKCFGTLASAETYANYALGGIYLKKSTFKLASIRSKDVFGFGASVQKGIKAWAAGKSTVTSGTTMEHTLGYEGLLLASDTSAITAILALNPDVVTISGDHRDVEGVLKMIRELDAKKTVASTKIKAIVATNAWTDTPMLLKEKKLGLLNGVMMPDQWMDWDDTSISYAMTSAAFRTLIGQKNANYHSASAFVAALAVMKAVNQGTATAKFGAASQIATVAAKLSAITTGNVLNTFFGPISFQTTGAIGQTTGIVYAKQRDYAKLGGYYQVKSITALSATSNMVWPMPAAVKGNGEKLVVGGFTQTSPHGAAGKIAIEAWKKWANGPKGFGVAVETVWLGPADLPEFTSYRNATAFAGLVESLLNTSEQKKMDVLIAPHGSLAATNFLIALKGVSASLRAMPVMIWGAADDAVIAECAALRPNTRCYGMFTEAKDYAIPALQAIYETYTPAENASRAIMSYSYMSKGPVMGLPPSPPSLAEVDAAGGLAAWKALQTPAVDALKTGYAYKVIQGFEAWKALQTAGTLNETARLNWTGSFNRSNGTHKAAVLAAVASKPDVVLIAMDSGDTEYAINLIRSVPGYNPKAIIATNAWTMPRANAVNDLHGVIMPNQWEESQCVRDPLTKWSAKDFRALMKSNKGVANYHSASAMAAMIVVSTALHKGTPGFQKTTLATNLQNFALLKTFYGPISFKSNGQIKKPMYAHQRFNRPGGHYDTKVVKSNLTVKYPMPPKWETLNMYGIIQRSGIGLRGKDAIDHWAKWVNGGASKGIDFTPNVHWSPIKAESAPYRDQVSLWSNITATRKDKAHVLIAPYGSALSAKFITSVPMGSKIPILVWGGAADTLFSSSCAGRQCFGTFTKGSLYTKPTLDAVLANAKVTTVKARADFAEAKAATAVALAAKMVIAKARKEAAKPLDICAASTPKPAPKPKPRPFAAAIVATPAPTPPDTVFAKITLVAITNNNAFSKSVHGGTLAWVASKPNDVTLLKNLELSGQGSLTAADKTAIAQIVALKPDVVTIAGHSGDVEDTIAGIRNGAKKNGGGYSPKAIIATNAWSSMAKWYEKKSMLLLRGVVMPDQWAADLSDVDSLTGLDADFLKKQMKSSASYHAASAFGAVSVIAHAMRKAPAGSKVQNFTKELTAMKQGVSGRRRVAVDTLYGKISFDASGVIFKPMFGRQFETMSKSSVVPPNHNLKYPMPKDAPCTCKYQGAVLTSGNWTLYPLASPAGCANVPGTCTALPGKHSAAALNPIYGSTCAAWDQMRNSPTFASCYKAGADDAHWAKKENNWCQQPWCYVDKECPDAVPSVNFRGNPDLFYSYQACGHYDDCYSYTQQKNVETPKGCPYDPYGTKKYKVHKGAGCECLYQGTEVTASLVSGSAYASATLFPYTKYYGTTCAAWDQMPGTPYYGSCPAGSDWCSMDFNYCQAPWCFVGSTCATKIASTVFGAAGTSTVSYGAGGAGAYYSYDTCLGTPNCRSGQANMPASCPFDYANNSWTTAKECSTGFTVTMTACVQMAIGAITKSKGQMSYTATPTAAATTLAKGFVLTMAGKFCPTQVIPVVEVQMSVNGVSHTSLVSNPTLHAAFKSTMCTVIATAAGTPVSGCTALLSAGSVKVVGQLKIPAGKTADSMKSSVSASNLVASAISSVTNLPNINSVTTGNIEVTGLVVTSKTVEVTAVAVKQLVCVAPSSMLMANGQTGPAQTFINCLKTNCENYAIGHHKAALRRLATSTTVAKVDSTQVFCDQHACGAAIDTAALAAADGTTTANAAYGIVSGFYGRDLCPVKCGLCTNPAITGNQVATPAPTRAQPTPEPTPEPTIGANGMAAVITLELRLTGVTFNELKDNPSIRSEFIMAVKSGILEASNLNQTNEIQLLLSVGSINIAATITPPAGSEHLYAHLCKKGIKRVASTVSTKVQGVPNIDSVGTGNIGVVITKFPTLEQLPASSFNAAFGQEAGEREYTDTGKGQCRLKNEQMKIPSNSVFTDAANDCRRLCNERQGCFGFTSNAVFVNTMDEATGVAGHEATGGTGPCVLWMQSGLNSDGYDEYDGSCFVKKAFCSEDMVCPSAQCGQCKATSDGQNVPSDADTVAKRLCQSELCDPETDSAVCCNAEGVGDETDAAQLTKTPLLSVLVLAAAALFFGHLN